jgi:hypothetical protein
MLLWVLKAKHAETRAQRIARLVQEMARRSKRRAGHSKSRA